MEKIINKGVNIHQKAFISFIFVLLFSMVNTASFAGAEAGNKADCSLEEHILIAGKG